MASLEPSSSSSTTTKKSKKRRTRLEDAFVLLHEQLVDIQSTTPLGDLVAGLEFDELSTRRTTPADYRYGAYLITQLPRLRYVRLHEVPINNFSFWYDLFVHIARDEVASGMEMLRVGSGTFTQRTFDDFAQWFNADAPSMANSNVGTRLLSLALFEPLITLAINGDRLHTLDLTGFCSGWSDGDNMVSPLISTSNLGLKVKRDNIHPSLDLKPLVRTLARLPSLKVLSLPLFNSHESSEEFALLLATPAMFPVLRHLIILYGIFTTLDGRTLFARALEQRTLTLHALTLRICVINDGNIHQLLLMGVGQPTSSIRKLHVLYNTNQYPEKSITSASIDNILNFFYFPPYQQTKDDRYSLSNKLRSVAFIGFPAFTASQQRRYQTSRRVPTLPQILWQWDKEPRHVPPYKPSTHIEPPYFRAFSVSGVHRAPAQRYEEYKLTAKLYDRANDYPPLEIYRNEARVMTLEKLEAEASVRQGRQRLAADRPPPPLHKLEISARDPRAVERRTAVLVEKVSPETRAYVTQFKILFQSHEMGGAQKPLHLFLGDFVDMIRQEFGDINATNIEAKFEEAIHDAATQKKYTTLMLSTPVAMRPHIKRALVRDYFEEQHRVRLETRCALLDLISLVDPYPTKNMVQSFLSNVPFASAEQKVSLLATLHESIRVNLAEMSMVEALTWDTFLLVADDSSLFNVIGETLRIINRHIWVIASLENEVRPFLLQQQSVDTTAPPFFLGFNVFQRTFVPLALSSRALDNYRKMTAEMSALDERIPFPISLANPNNFPCRESALVTFVEQLHNRAPSKPQPREVSRLLETFVSPLAATISTPPKTPSILDSPFSLFSNSAQTPTPVPASTPPFLVAVPWQLEDTPSLVVTPSPPLAMENWEEGVRLPSRQKPSALLRRLEFRDSPPPSQSPSSAITWSPISMPSSSNTPASPPLSLDTLSISTPPPLARPRAPFAIYTSPPPPSTPPSSQPMSSEQALSTPVVPSQVATLRDYCNEEELVLLTHRSKGAEFLAQFLETYSSTRARQIANRDISFFLFLVAFAEEYLRVMPTPSTVSEKNRRLFGAPIIDHDDKEENIGLGREKACQMRRENRANKHRLTKAQKGYFGMICGGGHPRIGNFIDEIDDDMRPLLTVIADSFRTTQPPSASPIGGLVDDFTKFTDNVMAHAVDAALYVLTSGNPTAHGIENVQSTNSSLIGTRQHVESSLIGTRITYSGESASSLIGGRRRGYSTRIGNAIDADADEQESVGGHVGVHKACEILHDGHARGHPLSRDQQIVFAMKCHHKNPRALRAQLTDPEIPIGAQQTEDTSPIAAYIGAHHMNDAPLLHNRITALHKYGVVLREITADELVLEPLSSSDAKCAELVHVGAYHQHGFGRVLGHITFCKKRNGVLACKTFLSDDRTMAQLLLSEAEHHLGTSKYESFLPSPHFINAFIGSTFVSFEEEGGERESPQQRYFDIKTPTHTLTMVCLIQYIPKLAGGDYEQPDGLEIYPSRTYASAESPPFFVAASDCKVPTRHTLTFLMDDPYVHDDAVLNFDAYALFLNPHGQRCRNQAGYENIRIAELLTQPGLTFRLELCVPNAAEKISKGEVFINCLQSNMEMEPNARSLQDVRRAFEDAEAEIDTYIQCNRKFYEAHPPSTPNITRITAFTYAGRKGYIPGALFDNFRLAKSHEEYYLHALNYAVQRRQPHIPGPVDLSRWLVEVDDNKAILHIMDMLCIYVNYCAYLTDIVDRNVNSRSHRQKLLELIESFDPMRPRDAGDCEDDAAEIIREVMELKYNRHTFKSAVMARVCDLICSFVFFAGLCAVSKSAIGDGGHNEEEDEQEDEAGNEPTTGHECVFAIPNFVFFTVLARHSPTHPLFTYYSEEERMRGSHQQIYVLEGTGHLHPEPRDKPADFVALGRRFNSVLDDKELRDLLNKQFFYHPRKPDNFYKKIITLMTPEFFYRCGHLGFEFLVCLQTKVAGLKRGVSFDTFLSLTQNDFVRIVEAPRLSPSVFQAATRINDDNFPPQTLEAVNVNESMLRVVEQLTIVRRPLAPDMAFYSFQVFFADMTPEHIEEFKVAMNKATELSMICRAEPVKLNTSLKNVAGGFTLTIY